MRFPVTKRFKDKNTGERHRPGGEPYETDDADRAKYLQRGGYIGLELPVVTADEDPTAAGTQEDPPMDEGKAPESAGTPQLPVVTADELAEMTRGALDEVAPLFLADYDPSAFKNKDAVREAIEKVMAEGA